MIIAFYGLDGSGKSTQSNALCDHLLRSGKKASVDNPFKNAALSTKLANSFPHKDMTYEEYWGGKTVGTLLLEDVWDNVHKSIRCESDYLIFDRYYLEFFVYSPILGSDLLFQRPILDSFPKADISIFIDEHPDVCYERIVERHIRSGIYVCKRENHDVLVQARNAFIQLSNQLSDFFVINAFGRNADIIADEIWEIVVQYL